MDGIHDLGGKQGYGFVDQTSKAHPFEAPWEGRVFAMLNLVARAGAYRNTDEFRHAIERIAEDHYFDHGYFGRWLSAMELLLLESGLVSSNEFDNLPLRPSANDGDSPSTARARQAKPADHEGQAATLSAMKDQDLIQSEPITAPKYRINQSIRTISHALPGHTRLPEFGRNREGTIVDCHGLWTFPDTSAHQLDPARQFLYTVRLTPFANDEGIIHLDLFEAYLEAN